MWQNGHQKQVEKLQVVNLLFAGIFKFLSGFLPNDAMFLSPYINFKGHTLDIVMSNRSNIFTKVFIYPDESKHRSGADFLAAQYLSQALNFKYR